MFRTAIACSCRLLCWLLCFFVTPLLAQEQRQSAIPGEIQSGVELSNGGLVLSSDGRWACFNSSAGIGLVDLHSGNIKGLGDRNQGWSVLINELPTASWSPVESMLAFKSYREGDMFLTVWSPVTESQRDLLAIPKGLYGSIFAPPVWSADGKTLYILIRQDLPWPKSHPDDDYPPNRNENVTLQYTKHYGAKIKRSRFEKDYEEAYAEKDRTLIMAVDVATGRAGVLAKGNDIAAVYLSPDNKRLVAVQPKLEIPGKLTRWTRQVYVDMYLLDTAPVGELPTINLDEMDDRRAGWFDHRGKRLNPVLIDVHLNEPDLIFFPPVRFFFGANGNPILSWSPDSQRFAYATVGRESKGDVFVYEVANGELRNLTADVQLSESPESLGYGDHYTWRFNSLKFGSLYPPLWLSDSQSLVAVGQGNAWMIPLDPRQKPYMLTGDIPQEVRRIVPANNQSVALMDADGALTLIAKDKTSRLDSLWKLNVANRQGKKLLDTGVWINRVALADKTGERLVYTGQNAQTPNNVYHILDAEAPQSATTYKMHLAERLYPKMRVLEWRTKAGETAQALLYLPEGASKSSKAPMILDGYPARFYARLDERVKSGPRFLSDALYGLLQEGFAVLYPDIELSDEGVYESPMWQTVEAVQSATETALATGVIDRQRLGIMGQSYGGYMTQAVITQTDLFRAAMSRAGLSDLYGGYAAGGRGSRKWSEIGQGRMAVPPWVDPERYIKNSPLSYFNKVKTPLLLLHGENDGTVPIEMSRESFRGLDRLDSPTVFARYRRLGHNTTQEVDRRVRLWFRQHLLGGEEVAGLAEQGSFFLGGELKQDKLSTGSSSSSEEK